MKKRLFITNQIEFFFGIGKKIKDSQIDSINFFPPLRKEIIKSLLKTQCYTDTARLLNLSAAKVRIEFIKAVNLLKMWKKAREKYNP